MGRRCLITVAFLMVLLLLLSGCGEREALEKADTAEKTAVSATQEEEATETFGTEEEKETKLSTLETEEKRPGTSFENEKEGEKTPEESEKEDVIPGFTPQTSTTALATSSSATVLIPSNGVELPDHEWN